VRAAVSLLGQAGAAITVATDAYRAMAQLVQSPGFAHLLLDVRDLDEAELGIVNVASRYCPTVACAALALPGTEKRLSRQASGIRVLDAAALAARIGPGGRPTVFPGAASKIPAGPKHTEEQTIEHALGVDDAASDATVAECAVAAPESDALAAAEEDEATTSMYEAVRARMREGAAPPVRRRPGEAGGLTMPPVSPHPVTETGVELTAAEIDALLAIERPASNSTEEAAS